MTCFDLLYAQVFTLLEIIYHAWDTIAHRRRVYKVETVGDSYVAIAGLPEERKDHAVAMARFACDCLHRLRSLVRVLEKVIRLVALHEESVGNISF